MLVVFGFIWYSSGPNLSSGVAVVVEEEGQLLEFEKINNISLDAQFFSDPFFVALQEFPVATDTIRYIPGRPNPFTPF